MNHGLSNDFLCAASKIDVTFQDDIGNKKSVSGTAFFVSNKRKEICLVTNRHVVDLDYKQPTSKYKNYKLFQVLVHNRVKNPSTGLPTEMNDILVLNFSEFQFSDKYENDIACLIGIKGIDYKKMKGSISLNYDIGYDLIADETRINEKLSICDIVAFPGYPPWFDRKNNLPILRTGTIASDPRFDYSFTGNDDGECIAYEAFSYGGSSGSPVFAIQKGFKVSGALSGGYYREIMLIGINAGHLPKKGVVDTHSGISYFYKSSAILDIIDKEKTQA